MMAIFKLSLQSLYFQTISKVLSILCTNSLLIFATVFPFTFKKWITAGNSNVTFSHTSSSMFIDFVLAFNLFVLCQLFVTMCVESQIFYFPSNSHFSEQQWSYTQQTYINFWMTYVLEKKEIDIFNRKKLHNLLVVEVSMAVILHRMLVARCSKSFSLLL